MRLNLLSVLYLCIFHVVVFFSGGPRDRIFDLPSENTVTCNK